MKVNPVLRAMAAGLVLSLSSALAQVPHFEQAVISVHDMAASEDVYTSVIGYKVVEKGEGPSPALQRLWNLPPGTTMKWELLGKSEFPGSILVRLVQFTPQAGRARYPYRDQDGGIMGMHVIAPDVPAAYSALSAKGFTAMHEPMLWAGCGGEKGVGQRTWYEVFTHGLDGEEWIVVPPSGPAGMCGPQPPPPKYSGLGPVRDVVFAVTNPIAAYNFYHGVLGWYESAPRWEGFGPKMEEMLRMPEGAIARPIYLATPDKSPEQHLTLTEFAGVAHVDLYSRNSPPSRGLIILAMHVPDLDHLYRAIVNAGVEVVLPPTTIPDHPYDGAKAFSVRGPDGVFIEFVQR